jgi:hypothetical protein
MLRLDFANPTKRCSDTNLAQAPRNPI